MTLRLATPEEIAVWDAEPKRPLPRHSPQCLCGRFAKWVGDRHYYNGTFDCYSFDVICSRCGVVTIECV